MSPASNACIPAASALRCVNTVNVSSALPTSLARATYRFDLIQFDGSMAREQVLFYTWDTIGQITLDQSRSVERSYIAQLDLCIM